MPLADIYLSVRSLKMSRSLLAVLVTCGLLLVAGCRSEESGDTPPTPKETVDVGPSLEIPIEDDVQAVPRKVDVSGIMPSNFPKGLPLYPESSLVNFGDTDGKAWVDLISSDRSQTVERGLRGALGGAGWSIDETAPRVWALAKGQARVRLIFRDGEPGTIYRYEY